MSDRPGPGERAPDRNNEPGIQWSEVECSTALLLDYYVSDEYCCEASVKLVLRYYDNRNGSAIYACSLDLEAAFHDIAHSIMCQNARGVLQDKFWRVLMYWESMLTVHTCIRWNCNLCHHPLYTSILPGYDG